MAYEDYKKLPKVSGVYLLTCNANGKQYVGSSVDIKMRVGTHFYRDFKKFPWREFYQDIGKYGFDGFSMEVLELCDRNDMLEREQYYYDKLQPVYNFARPVKCPFELDEVKRLAKSTEKYHKSVELRRERYNTPEYKELFRSTHKEGYNAMKPCSAYTKEGEKVASFRSLAEASRWVEVVAPQFKAKNKTSKVKAVCDGERPTAFGYVFKYDQSVTTTAQAGTHAIGTCGEADGTPDLSDVKR